MGNNSSRGAYPPQYPPKHTYYSERRGHKPRKGGGGKMRYREEDEYEYGERYPPHMHSSSRYPHQYNTYHAGFAAPYNYQPIPPPQLPFPNVSTPSPYPVIPPVPPRHHYSSSAPIIPGNSYLSQPNVHMPEPAPAAPVYPNQPMPGGPVIPNMSYPSAHPHASSFPVIPPDSTPFPQPQVGGGPGTATSDEYTPPPNMHEGQPLAPGQYGPSRVQYSPLGSVKFHENPLPTPPKDLFELSPYVGLLKDLHRPIEETTLRRAATSPQYVNAYIVSPNGSQASREKKPRKGLFRSLSNRLAGKHKRELSEPPTAHPIPVVLATTGVPPPATMYPPVIPGAGYGPVIPPPGTVFSAGSPAGFVPDGQRPSTPQPPQAPPSPAPSHRSQRSHHSPRSAHRSSPAPQPTLKIGLHTEYSGLTHLSPHRILHSRKRWPSAFHLLEALRFIDTRPDLAEQIRMCPNVDEVKAIVSQNSASSRPDWEHVVIPFMEEVLYEKFIQHPDLRRLLLSTGVTKLLHVDPHDNFWGDGPLGHGANELGRALEHVRERLVSEGFTADDS